MNKDKINIIVNFKNGKKKTVYVDSEKDANHVSWTLLHNNKHADFIGIGNGVYEIYSIESVEYERNRCFTLMDRNENYDIDRYDRIHYVLGIVFTKSGKVLLQLKNRGNSYINGKLNGLGGKKENFENTYHAMSREFEEETGWTEKVDWKAMMAMEYDNCVLYVYHATIDDEKFETFEFTSDDENAEELVFIDIDDLPNHYDKMANNLQHIIGICLDDLNNG